MLHRLLALCMAVLLSNAAQAVVDKKSGLVIAPGFDVVSVQCTVCHSGRLVAQNRADRQGWLGMIRWMQETQGLWPLGEQEEVILDYLATHYGPVSVGRRQALAPEFLPPGGVDY
jgi:hypothetical protein